METKNKIVRYSERFNGMEKASAVLWHYKNVSAAEKEVDGVYVVPAVYLLLHRSFGEKIDRKEAEAVCAEGVTVMLLTRNRAAFDASVSQSLPSVQAAQTISPHNNAASVFIILFSCFIIVRLVSWNIRMN